MNIRATDGRVLSGTPRQIMQQAQSFSFGGDSLTLDDFVRGEARRAADFGHDIELPDDATTDELCSAFIEGALVAGLFAKA